MTKLKPCPFCGSKKVEVLGGRGCVTYFVWCKNCNCEGPNIPKDICHDVDTKEAIKKWNKRRK